MPTDKDVKTTNRSVVDGKKLEQHFCVPDEIKAQGTAAVAKYLEMLSSDVERLDEARIIILGDAGAGKTSLARKLQKITNPMPTIEERTVGVDVLNWPLPKDQKGNSMNVHIWDFAGQTVTHAAHRCFMSSRCLYIYVFNGRVERGNDPEYWLEQIKMHGGNSPVLFLINKKDDHAADIPKNTLKREYPNIIDYYSVDIGNKDTTKLEKFRQTVMDCVRSEPSWNSQNISEDAYRVKAELNSRFKDGQVDLISREDFYDIARNQKVPEKDWDSVLDDLRVLGICLWYEDKKMKLENYVLNPEWITNGIYKIIQWGRIKGKYELSIDDGKEIFVEQKDQQRYLGKMKFLFDLMAIYELAYFKKNSSKELVIPILMPSDRPEGLPIFPYGERLAMMFVVERVLPPNIVSRVIVQRSEEIVNEIKLWRKGAVLKYRKGSAVALITEEQRKIVVCVKGKQRTAYIKSIRETLNNIFESYKAIEPDLYYEVLMPGKLESTSQNIKITSIGKNESPLMLQEEDIKGYLRSGRPYFDVHNNRIIPLHKTNQDYAIPQEANLYNLNCDLINVNTNIPINAPRELTSENFPVILGQIEVLLQSEEVVDISSPKDRLTLKKAIDAAKAEQDPKVGWKRVIDAISESGVVASIVALSLLNPASAAVCTGLPAITVALKKLADSTLKKSTSTEKTIETTTPETRIQTEEEKRKILVDTLKQKYHDKNLVLVIGAGVSIDSKIPSWDELIKKLLIELISNELKEKGKLVTEDEIKRIAQFTYNNMEDSPLTQIRVIKSELDDDVAYKKSVHKVLYGNNPEINTDLLKAIGKLCTPNRRHSDIKHVITYNFDDLLERVLANKDVDYKIICSDKDVSDGNALNIYHVHGYLPKDLAKINFEANLVFSEEDYHKIYRDAYEWSNIVQLNSFRENTCLFIGCSLNDPNLRRLLDVAARCGGEPHHYAIMKKRAVDKEKINDSDIKLFEEYTSIDNRLRKNYFHSLGVNVIWVNNYDEIPQILLKLIEAP